MDVKKFLSAGLAGGLVIVMISYIADIIVQTTYPYDVMSFGGMRAPEDPLMLLFFLHYWVISFAMAYVWTHLNLFSRVILQCKAGGMASSCGVWQASLQHS